MPGAGGPARHGSLLARGLLALLALGLVRGSQSSGLRFLPGDPITVLKRSQYRGERSSWREIPHDACPRFERFTVVALHALPADFAVDEPPGAGSDYKMAFSFLNEQFQTPWLTIADGRGHFLTHLIFTLEKAGDRVTDISWQTVYDVPNAAPPHVQIEYEFANASEEDPRTALTALFVGSLALAVLAAAIVVGDSVEYGAVFFGRAPGPPRRRGYDDA